MVRFKKIVLGLVLGLTICALMSSALAAWGTMYANREKVKVYAEDNTDSEVIKKYKGGKKITVDAVSPDGKWAQISINGGLGFILMDQLSSEMPQSFCPHEWGKWTVDRQPTCTQTGYRYRFCKICGIRDEQEMKKLDHEYGKWKVTKQATCVKKGTRVRTCKECGHKQEESYLEDHDFGPWSMTKQPTCTEKGERVHTCRVCGLEKSQVLDKLPHDYEWSIITPATDHSAGTRAKICRVCSANGGVENYDPEGTLRRKAKGQAVRDMQQLLVDQGYLNVGGVDGAFGGGTEKALRQFQLDQGLTVDGIAWPQTLQRLNHDFGPWQTMKPMTRSTAGQRVRVCKDCGYQQMEAIQPGTVYERGRRGEEIRAMQQMIKQVGYDAGGFDGIYGKKLDAAMAKFAAANGFTVEEGKIRPSDVDALVNAWIKTIPDDNWMGEGDPSSPVNLGLTVTANGEPDADNITTYSWSLTNLGTEKAMFNALLLAFGDAPDFRQDVLVMVLDGEELKKGAGNSVSGSFTASSDWGEGNMHFAAMAVSEKTGMKWLSNDVVFENESTPAVKAIAPMPVDIDVNHLADGIYPVSFNRGDVLGGATGIYLNGVHIYTQDWYDLVDVSKLNIGDTIMVEGEEVPVITLTRSDIIEVNDGQDARSFIFATEEDSNGYTIRGLDDMATYTDHGVTTLVVDPSATFTDAWDIDSMPLIVGYDGIVDAIQNSQNEYFVQYNTTVRIEGGKVVEIKRDYVP